MSVDAVNLLRPLAGTDETGAPGAAAARAPADFASWLDRQMVELNDQLNSSELDLRRLASGETNNIHHVMMSLEKARLSFQLVLQVRNKVLEAYQDVMRMQI
ncbi:MAG TPA: flagellar hook-basal body complex protein FliE [Gammaproteobacteria bacterium]|nr:flagellar hook-basal body complex protein FliE [Gammaproteobacteria bacterium]